MNECAAEVIVVEVVGVSSMCDNCTELFLINRITVGAGICDRSEGTSAAESQFSLNSRYIEYKALRMFLGSE